MWTTNWADIETPSIDPGDLMHRAAVARMLKVAPKTFDEWVKAGAMPQGVYVGKTKKWSRRRLVAFIEQKFIEQTLGKQSKTA